MSRSASEVSVITVNWNGIEHLRHLLPSLFPLGAKEIIVVDNGSSDGSQDFLRSHSQRVRLIENQVNRGFCQPNNLAAKSAKGSILAFINNDMRADPAWLEAGLKKVAVFPCVASRILDWQGDRVDFNGSSLQYLGYALQRDEGAVFSRLTDRDRLLFACGGAMLIEREIFLRSGGFDEEYFAVFEDVDLGWRLWLQGYEVGFAPDSVTYHRKHGTFQKEHNEKLRYLMHRNALRTIIKNYDDENLRRILPHALALAVARAVRCSGVQRESFYIWSDVKSRLREGDTTAYHEVLDALNHLVALDDVLKRLPQILLQRQEVQEKRRRPDSEILGLFIDPLRPIVEDPEYLEQELDYTEFLGLDSLWETGRLQEYLARLPKHPGPKLDRLRKELNGLQWVGTQAVLHPPSPPSPAGKAYQTWKSAGFLELLRLIGRKLRRGN